MKKRFYLLFLLATFDYSTLHTMEKFIKIRHEKKRLRQKIRWLEMAQDLSGEDDLRLYIQELLDYPIMTHKEERVEIIGICQARKLSNSERLLSLGRAYSDILALRDYLPGNPEAQSMRNELEVCILRLQNMTEEQVNQECLRLLQAELQEHDAYLCRADRGDSGVEQ